MEKKAATAQKNGGISPIAPEDAGRAEDCGQNTTTDEKEKCRPKDYVFDQVTDSRVSNKRALYYVRRYGHGPSDDI